GPVLPRYAGGGFARLRGAETRIGGRLLPPAPDRVSVCAAAGGAAIGTETASAAATTMTERRTRDALRRPRGRRLLVTGGTTRPDGEHGLRHRDLGSFTMRLRPRRQS